MFKKHFDLQNNQWNIFKVVNGREEYVCSFHAHEKDLAQAFCNSANSEVVNA